MMWMFHISQYDKGGKREHDTEDNIKQAGSIDGHSILTVSFVTPVVLVLTPTHSSPALHKDNCL
jgi:hypothetical protein